MGAIGDELCVINFNLSEGDFVILEKMEQAGEKVESFADVRRGVMLYETGKGNPPQKAEDAQRQIYEMTSKLDETYRPFLEGKDVDTYVLKYQNRWVKYGPNLAAPRDPVLFEGARLLVRRIVGQRLIATYVDGDFVTSQLLQIVKPFGAADAKYLLAVLNSTLVAWYFRKKYNRLDKTFPEIRVYELESIPVPCIAAEAQAPFVAQADLLLQKHRELHEGTSTFLRLLQANFPLATLPKKLEEWHRLNWKEFLEEMKKANAPLKPSQQAEWLAAFEEQQKTAGHALAAIGQADRKLDRMVFELYGLTEAEVALVERSA